MKRTPYLKDISALLDNPPETNIKSVIIYKTASCGITGQNDNKNGRTMGVVYKDGREVKCVHND